MSTALDRSLVRAPRRTSSVLTRVLLLAPVCLVVAFAAHAASLGERSRAEIDALLTRLGASNCVFFRNGEWRSAADAKAHLATKLRFLVEHGMVESAEQFIERAGTTSSTSGVAYQVRCGDAAPVASAAWLTRELGEVRRQSKPTR